MIDAIADRVITAFTTLPDIQGWLFTAAILGIYAAIAIPTSLRLQFTTLELQQNWKKIAIVLITTFFIPGLSEELLFRAILLPHPSETTSTIQLWLWISVNLVLFVAYHPFEGLTYAKVQQKTMMNPVFLLLAGLLGMACAIAYLHTGSIWPSVIIHWVTVAVWRLCLGGDRELFGEGVESS